MEDTIAQQAAVEDANARRVDLDVPIEHNDYVVILHATKALKSPSL